MTQSRRYETFFISDPDIGEEKRTQLLDRVKEIIGQYGGHIVEVEDWGVKKLAYEIKKKPRGYYVRVDYLGEGELVHEMERNFRIDDRIMKYMTIILDKNTDLEKVNRELAEKKNKAAKASEKEANLMDDDDEDDEYYDANETEED